MANCAVMGIVNVTPDSFSDGGKYFEPTEAVRRARRVVADGAAIVDLGGESTRPGAERVPWQEEWARLEPVLRALAPTGGMVANAIVSIDTYHPETAERALAAGAGMINCVYAESAADMAALCRARSAAIVLPSSALDANPALAQGFPAHRLYADPMIGFGTTREEDLALLRGVRSLAARYRVLVGASRKRIVKKLTGEKVTGKNLGGNVAIALWCALNGASAVRVHDVLETVQALKVLDVLSAGGDGAPQPTFL